MSIPEHYSNHPDWHDHPWDYQAMGHKENGVRPCSCCHQPIDQGWITEDGSGPWCSPACMGWDDKDVMDEDISNMPRREIAEDGLGVVEIDGNLFWTDWVDDPSDDPAWRAEVKEEYAWAWEEIQGTKIDPKITLYEVDSEHRAIAWQGDMEVIEKEAVRLVAEYFEGEIEFVWCEAEQDNLPDADSAHREALEDLRDFRERHHMDYTITDDEFDDDAVIVIPDLTPKLLCEWLNERRRPYRYFYSIEEVEA